MLKLLVAREVVTIDVGDAEDEFGIDVTSEGSPVALDYVK